MLTVMANKQRRKRRTVRRKSSSKRRRRRNPAAINARPKRRRRYNRSANMGGHRRRRRNPAIFGGGKSLAVAAGFAIGGGIATRALPQMLLGAGNTGIFGYVANGVSLFALSWAAKNWVNKSAGDAVMLGGAVMIAGRLVKDFAGPELVAFGAIPGLSGDAEYGALAGEFLPASFLVPSASPLGVKALPADSAEAVATANGNSLGSPWDSPWAN